MGYNQANQLGPLRARGPVPPPGGFPKPNVVPKPPTSAHHARTTGGGLAQGLQAAALAVQPSSSSLAMSRPIVSLVAAKPLVT